MLLLLCPASLSQQDSMCSAVCCVSLQVYEYFDSSSGIMYVAVPPPGLPLSSLLAQVLSRALGSPLTLPLHPLLEVSNAEQLKSLQPVLLPGMAGKFCNHDSICC